MLRRGSEEQEGGHTTGCSSSPKLLVLSGTTYVALKGGKVRLQCLQPDLPGFCLGKVGGGVLGPECPLGQAPHCRWPVGGLCEACGGAGPLCPSPRLPKDRQIKTVPTSFLCECFVKNLLILL